jgi:CubicO group peptidase (beta-lactamase class C family)
MSDRGIQPRGDRSEQARAALNALITRGKTPGIQYVVVDSARTLFEYDGGWADLGNRIPMRPDTTLMAYSMSKTITAVAALTLVQERCLDLDRPIDDYVEGSPYGPAVTVRQLISHTSGIPNPIPLRWVHPADATPFDEPEALARVLRQYARLASRPGTRYAYSNIGYWLLGSVIARASGAPFTAYVDRHLREDLRLSPDDLGYMIPDPARHAAGYLEKYSWINLLKGFLVDPTLIGDYERRWLRIRSHYVNGPAFGGLVGTARGFATFLQDQLRHRSRLLDEATRALFYTPQQVASHTLIPMTLGWHVGTGSSGSYFYKEGGGGGFHCMMRLYPGNGVGTVVMTNATGFDVYGCLNSLDPLFLT